MNKNYLEHNNVQNFNRLLKPEEVAHILSTSRSLVYQLIQQGKLPSIRIGRSVRVRQRDLENFINSQVSTVSKSL